MYRFSLNDNDLIGRASRHILDSKQLRGVKRAES